MHNPGEEGNTQWANWLAQVQCHCVSSSEGGRAPQACCECLFDYLIVYLIDLLLQSLQTFVLPKTQPLIFMSTGADRLKERHVLKLWHRVRTRSLYYHVIFSAICTLSHQMIYMLCKLLNIYLLKSLFLVLRKKEYFLTKQPNESFGSCFTYVCRRLHTTGPTSSTVRRSCGTLHTW